MAPLVIVSQNIMRKVGQQTDCTGRRVLRTWDEGATEGWRKSAVKIPIWAFGAEALESGWADYIPTLAKETVCTQKCGD